MCGRYALYLSPESLKARLGLDHLLNFPPRYNAGPMQQQPVVVKSRAGMARWGFRPEWAVEDDPAMAIKMINARSETVHEKPAFRESWAKARRCLVPANGFYEWSKDDQTGVNQPYYITHDQADLLFFAGLWSKVDGQVSFTILTKQADDNLSHLHHRSPVMVSENDVDRWFNDFDAGLELIKRSTTQGLKFHRVSTAVGTVANDRADLIEEVGQDTVLKEAGQLL